MNEKKKLFEVNVSKYDAQRDFFVYWPASLDKPASNAVMFMMARYADSTDVLLDVNDCLVFWDESMEVPGKIDELHVVVKTQDARKAYNRFFRDNNITNLPQSVSFSEQGGAVICDDARIGDDCTIMPGAYIGPDVVLGNNVYVGCGSKLVGHVVAGNNVVIRENTVIGADGLSTDRDDDGSALTMPQFGGVVLGDNVQIGANTVIARGAIDNTVIESGCKVDNSSFISHNVVLGKDTFVVGETIMFGGSHTGERAFLSGNVTVRNKVGIGDDAVVGMGAVVTKNVEPGSTVMGNPAKPRG